MDVKVEEGQPPTPCFSPLSQELAGWIYPPNNSLFLLFSTSFTLSSYFTSHMWEIPPSLTQNTHFSTTCSLLLVLRCLWSILSKSICAKWRIDWIILTFGSLYICVCFFRWLSRRSEAAVVSCLVWIHSDSDLLCFC